MPAHFARRGRPRGSGLDDRAQLRAISDMLEADPALKPTTAIKKIGVSDPSTIRRLRDKLRHVPGDDISPAVGSGSVDRPVALQGLPARSAHAQAKLDSREAGHVASVTADLNFQLLARPRSDGAVLWFTAWCALGLHAFSATVEVQLAAVEGILLMPKFASVLKPEAPAKDVSLASSFEDPDIRKTVH